MAGWLDGWLAGWLPGWLDGWLAGWLAGWLFGVAHEMRYRAHAIDQKTSERSYRKLFAGARGPIHMYMCTSACLGGPRGARGAMDATCAPSTSRCVFAQRPSKVHVRSLARESQSKVMFFQHDFHRIWGFECTCVEPVSLQKPYFFPTMSWEAAAQGQKGAIFLRFCPHEGSRLVCCFSACSLGPPRSSSKPNRKHIQFLYVCKMFFLGLQTLTFFAHFVLWAAVSKISIPRNVENQIYLTHRKKRAFLALRSSLQTNCWKKLGFLQAARFDKI